MALHTKDFFEEEKSPKQDNFIKRSLHQSSNMTTIKLGKLGKLTRPHCTETIDANNQSHKKFHMVRGYPRVYSSGKMSWVKPHTRGGIGIEEKNYPKMYTIK